MPLHLCVRFLLSTRRRLYRLFYQEFFHRDIRRFCDLGLPIDSLSLNTFLEVWVFAADWPLLPHLAWLQLYFIFASVYDCLLEEEFFDADIYLPRIFTDHDIRHFWNPSLLMDYLS